MNIEQARFNMVEQQIRPWGVLDQRILSVLLQTPREKFVPQKYQQLAFADFNIPLSHQQFMFYPKLEGRILQCLALCSTDKVLEIGTGSGYLTACLAQLADHVESIDLYQDLIDHAEEMLLELGYGNVSLAVGNAPKQWGNPNQYDAIILSGALPEVPDTYKLALAENGRLFAVIGQAEQPIMEAILITRKSKDQWMKESLFETWMPPLFGVNT